MNNSSPAKSRLTGLAIRCFKNKAPGLAIPLAGKFLVAVLVLAAFAGHSQTNTTETGAAAKPALKKTVGVDFAPELAQATADLRKKFDHLDATHSDFDENLSAINRLILKYRQDGNREQLARLYLLAAHIQADGLTNRAKAMAIWKRVLREFPGTLAAQGAAISLNWAQAQAAADSNPASSLAATDPSSGSPAVGGAGALPAGADYCPPTSNSGSRREGG